MLEEIRDNNDSYNTDWEDYREQILAYLYPGEQDITEAQEFATNVKGLFNSKFLFIEEFKNFFSGLEWGSEAPSLKLSINGHSSDLDFSAWDGFAETVRYMLAFFIYGTFAIRAYKRMPEIISTGGGDE